MQGVVGFDSLTEGQSGHNALGALGINRVSAIGKQLAGAAGTLTRLLEREVAQRAQTKHALAAVALIAQHPGLHPVWSDLEIEAVTVRVASRLVKMFNAFRSQAHNLKSTLSNPFAPGATPGAATDIRRHI